MLHGSSVEQLGTPDTPLDKLHALRMSLSTTSVPPTTRSGRRAPPLAVIASVALSANGNASSFRTLFATWSPTISGDGTTSVGQCSIASPCADGRPDVPTGGSGKRCLTR
jgi:hypothetical protein